MPALPKLFDGAGFIGGIEIYRKLDMKHVAQPHSHIAVPAEIKINLERIGEDD